MQSAKCRVQNGANEIAAAQRLESNSSLCILNSALAANAFSVLQPDWVQLCPYGDFAHARGLQRVDRAAAEQMVAQFNSFLGRAGRLFGGVPFYVGHPDMPGTSEVADRKAYGWITALEAREDGLYGFAKWSEAGLELLRNAHFKFLSPYWEAKDAGTEDGQRVYRPVALISVGLTNQPNIPVRPLANDASRIGQLALASGMTKDQIAMTTGEADRNVRAPIGSEINHAPGSADILVRPDAEAREFGEESQSLVTSTATGNEVERFNLADVAVEVELENALSAGWITPAEVGEWSERLGNDFAGTARELEARAPVMRTVSRTERLGSRKGELVQLQNRRDRIRECVLAKEKLGMSYDEAWQSVKREHPTWFE